MSCLLMVISESETFGSFSIESVCYSPRMVPSPIPCSPYNACICIYTYMYVCLAICVQIYIDIDIDIDIDIGAPVLIYPHF